MGKKSKIIMGLATAAMIPAILTGCGHKEHDAKDEWESDATHHWHECEGKKCEEKLDKAEHEATGTWLTSETHHWKDCDDCGYDTNYATHTYDKEVVSQSYLKSEATATAKAQYYKSCVCGKKGTETFESGKKVGEITNLAINNKTYDGQAIASPTYNKNTDGTATIEYKVKTASDTTYTTTAPSNAGEYTARVTIAESDNYSSVVATKDFTISKFVISGLEKEFTYNGEAVQSVELPGAMNLPDDNVKMEMTFASANAGASVASVKVLVNDIESENYVVEDCETSIAKATPSFNNVAMTSATIVYGDDYNIQCQSITHFYESSANGYIVQEYYVEDAWTTEKPTDAGNYKARLRVLESTNYNEVISEEVEFEIEAYKLEGLQTIVTYNGTLYHFVNLDEIADGLRLDISFNSEDVGATPTAVQLTLNGEETQNYEIIINGPNACTVEIVAKEVTLEWTAPNLNFDGTEKEPTVVATDLCEDDTCDVTIIKASGDNVTYGESFTFEATGLSNDNYKLPTNITSPTYTINDIESMTVDTAEDVGYVEYGTPEFLKITLGEGYYSFDFGSQSQGATFVFELYKTDTNVSIKDVTFENGVSSDNLVFKITESGEYYIKWYLPNNETVQDDTLTIVTDTHAEINEQGLCVICGEHRGDTIEAGKTITLSLQKDQKAYYRVAYTYDKYYSRTFTSPLQSGDMKFYRMDSDGNFHEIALTNNAIDFQSPFDDYIYIVITAGATFENGSFTVIEHDTLS